jgi:type I restriction enzyme S subunit
MVPVSELATAVVGGTPSRNVAEYWHGDIPWATAKDVAAVSGRYLEKVEEHITCEGLENSAAKLLPKSTVVITARGTVGAMAQLGREMAFNQTCYALLPKDGVDNDFLFYALKGTITEMRVLSYGTIFETITTKTFDHWLVPLPPLPEQRAIAHILGALDDKIELNRRMSETLEAMARALFKSWFVDFEPVRAKMEGRWKRGQSLPGLPAYLWDLFPDRLVDSELGEIPEGWDVATLADFAALNLESWSKDTRPEVIRYVDLSNTKWGRIEAVTTHTRHDAPSRAQRVLRPGDTLVGTVRPGNGSYALVAEEGLTGSTGFAVLRPQKAEWAEFVYLAATAASNIDTLAHLADGAAYPAVRPEVVASTPVVRPDDSVLGEFSKYAAPLLARMAQSERESRTLAALRDALLPKLLSGKIDVPACAADVAAGRSALEGAADPPAQAGEVA